MARGRAVIQPPSPFLFTDTFASTQNPYTGQGSGLGGASFFGDWGDMQTASGHCYGTTFSDVDYDDSLTVWDTGSADHYVEAVIWRSSPSYNPGVSHEAQLIVRAGGSAGTLELLEILFAHDGTNIQLVRWNGDLNDVDVLSWDSGGNMGRVPEDGDVVRAEIIGNELTVYLNDVEVASVTLADHAGNTMAGIMCFARTGATLANYGFHSVEVGEL